MRGTIPDLFRGVPLTVIEEIDITAGNFNKTAETGRSTFQGGKGRGFMHGDYGLCGFRRPTGGFGRRLCDAGLLVRRGGRVVGCTRGLRGIGCGVVCIRGGCVGYGRSIRGRFAQKGQRSAHQLGTTQCREALDVVQ